MTRTVELPSGLHVEFSALTWRDARRLTSARGKSEAEIVTDVLAGTTHAVVDPGPYQFEDRVNWDDVLVADRTIAKLAVRAATYPGEEYEFSIRCARDGCRRKFTRFIDLDDLLDNQQIPLPDTTRERVAAGKFEFNSAEVLDGWERPDQVLLDNPFTFRLMRGRDLRRAEKYVEAGTREERLTRVIVSRLVEIKGERMQSKMLRVLDGLPLRLMEMVEVMDWVDGGVETLAEVECPALQCGWMGEVEVPFEGTEFWTPSRNRRKRRTRAEMRSDSPG